MFVVSHMSVYLPHVQCIVYPHVFAEKPVRGKWSLSTWICCQTQLTNQVKSTLETIICNVHDYFDQQSRKQKSIPPTCTCKLCEKTTEATGISVHTVNCVLLEKRKLDGSSFTSQNKIYIYKKKQRKGMLVASKSSY